ncbi:RHS repeat-associated core domain-containing protein [Zobellia sp. 1_MG-2023]|uniref:RHS repeat-associated core domain-containing protein n=1 Tax=Zobellia sp. 1_MG-2023 TaxID=3062626 RepID=UPI0026E1C96A|nr:RHS repeat-associated core domain-containing protein [Zobellia sp. 1_MG-2023]MDO6819023.1 RHS repeat-associated core domain-containing protein [Zobellia sp. 1_MG-2023]
MYGKVRKLVEGDVDDCPFRYQGQYEDAETGLYYNRFRYYAADTGTYLSQDPIGLHSGEPNFYSYVNDSNSWVDSLGLMPIPTDVSFAGSPDLFPTTGNQKNIVQIVLTGDRDADFTRAFKEAGITRAEAKAQGKYTWHHVHDFDPVTGTSTMELVTTKAHKATIPHKGSAGQFSDHFGVEYDTYESKMKAYEQGWRKKPTKISCG